MGGVRGVGMKFYLLFSRVSVFVSPHHKRSNSNIFDFSYSLLEAIN